ncbi:ABC transporter substrate-binding protein [Rhodococcus koreensis]
MHIDLPTIGAHDALLYGANDRRLRIGVVLPRSGLMGLSGPSVLEAVGMAAVDLNRRAGSRQIDLVLVDSGRQPESVADEVVALVEHAGVAAFVGVHTSYTLQYIVDRLPEAVHYAVAVGHEGQLNSPRHHATGETPWQAIPGLRWLITERHVRRWALLSTEYSYPDVARIVQRETLAAEGCEVVLDASVAQNRVRPNASRMLDLLGTSGAEGVVVNMAGRDAVTMLRALRAGGFDRRTVRFAPGVIDENALLAINGDCSGNLYSSMQSFVGLQTEARQQLDDRFDSLGSEAPLLTSWAERAHNSVISLVDLAESGQLGRVLDMPPSPTLSAGGSYLAVAVGHRFEVIPAASTVDAP